MRILFAIAITLMWMTQSIAQQEEELPNPIAALQQEAELARKLTNPIAALVSLPLQYNWDVNIPIGKVEWSFSWGINFQPVISFGLSDKINVISRTIIPIVSQHDFPDIGGDESGLGDILQSFFFSPANESADGWSWGIGPVLLLPTASNNSQGREKWGLGPTAIVLNQSGPWTFGGLVNHIRTVGGNDEPTEVNATFIQPFMSYVTKTFMTFSFSTETTYDWENEVWSVPINFNVSQMLKIGSQFFQIGVGGRYWAETPDGGGEDLGGRLQLTYLLPRE